MSKRFSGLLLGLLIPAFALIYVDGMSFMNQSLQTFRGWTAWSEYLTIIFLFAGIFGTLAVVCYRCKTMTFGNALCLLVTFTTTATLFSVGFEYPASITQPNAVLLAFTVTAICISFGLLAGAFLTRRFDFSETDTAP